MTLQTRIETDALGDMEVPDDRLWGAQTQRSLQNFPIGRERFSADFIHALAMVKEACANSHGALGHLDSRLTEAIVQAAREVSDGRFDDEFPLVVWQTGSGTQTHMNVNEVIANRASELLGGRRGEKAPVHPNDHVNKGQSTNDIFPTAMHVAAAIALHQRLLPALTDLQDSLLRKADDFDDLVKTGRTHLQDATPLTLGQEFSAYVAQMNIGHQALKQGLDGLMPLAVGGTAVGTGLNAPEGFAEEVVSRLQEQTGLVFTANRNPFAGLAGHEAMVEVSGACKTLAVALYKIANDIRLLASGPRCGIGELELPANEPGSSIMPGKINPTQCEALTMVCAQVIGNDATLTFSASQGQLQLNAYKPVIIHTLLQSIDLLTDAMISFRVRCAEGIKANTPRIQDTLQQSLMLVTALTPHIGYDAAVAIAQHAHRKTLSLREAALSSGKVSEAEYDRWVVPHEMV